MASTASAEAAFVVKGDGYWNIWDGNGDNLGWVIPVHFQYVFTNDDDGTVNLIAHGTMPDWVTLPDKAVHFETYHNGFICSSNAPYFKYTLTPKGNFKMKCSSEPFTD